jgi:uncharacterized protein
MKTIALEEHFKTSAIRAANADHPLEKAYAAYGGPEADADVPPGILDIAEQRIAAMDAGGIDVQVLSHTVPSTESLESGLAIKLAAQANDQLATAVTAHPDRFAGFATLPMPDPRAAAAELDRAVTELGFVGAMVNGQVGDHYLDDRRFWPVLEKAEQLGVPIYLHPGLPPQAVIDACYSGFPPLITFALSGPGWGWHVDTGLHILRMIVGGVFDAFPALQVITGHMGEALPGMLWRADSVLSELGVTQLKLRRTVIEYFTEHFHVTTSGWRADEHGAIDLAAFLALQHVIGTDRILFAVDYPYNDNAAARRFLDNLPISHDDKHKIAHRNAEQLLGIQTG